MRHTIALRHDRPGHTLIAAVIALFACLVPGRAAAEGPGAYKAQRFDVVVTPSGGSLDVVETIVFEFQSGTFRKVWRDIPAARTDGIQIVDARMDDSVMPRGEGEGRVEVSGGNRVKVQWTFPPIGPSVHTFQLHYIARGAVFREGDADAIRWRALPTEHRYAIDSSRITLATPDARVLPVETHRLEGASQTTTERGVIVEANGIRSNGWLTVDLRYPAGTLIGSVPQWQQRHQSAVALAPRWGIAAVALLLLGLLAATAARRGYSKPSVPEEATTSTSPPEPLPAALAAVLAAKGRASPYHAISTLLDLAERGAVTIQELPRSFGAHNYQVAQVAGAHDLELHEQTALSIAFAQSAETVTLAKARARLVRGGRRFVAAVNEDLERRGLLEPARKAVRDRVAVVAVVLLIASPLACVGAAALIPRYDAWPFLLPLALFVAGVAAAIIAASTSPLSDRGAIESARWRGFRRHLKTLVGNKNTQGSITIDSRWIVYAIAVGLATQWARYLKTHPGVVPPWFLAASRDDRGAFAAFLGSQAIISGGHGGGAGGGAAGGGGSGAG